MTPHTPEGTVGRLRYKKRRVYSAERNAKIAKAQTKHGMFDSREYQSWEAMKYRCNSPTCPHYANYGGRGIAVCDRWMKFENFYEDMGRRPPNTTLDRINNDGNYEPRNCRWATRQQQNTNRRDRPKENYAIQRAD